MSKRWKNVSVGECFGIILTSIICLCVVFVPSSINPFAFAFKSLPFIGDGALIDSMGEVSEVGLGTIVNGAENYTDLLKLVYKISIIAYIGILAFDIFAAFLLIVTRTKFLRKFFRFFSIIAGIVMILILLINIVYIVSSVLYFAGANLPVLDAVNKTSIIFAFVFLVLSILLVCRQFEWYKSPFKF